MNILGDSIQLIEQQSDILRRLIEHQGSRDKKRRTAEQQELLLALTEQPEVKIDADDVFHQIITYDVQLQCRAVGPAQSATNYRDRVVATP
jgi:hypothetical protein